MLCSALEDNFPKLKGAGRFEFFRVEEGETHKANCLLSTLVHLQIWQPSVTKTFHSTL